MYDFTEKLIFYLKNQSLDAVIKINPVYKNDCTEKYIPEYMCKPTIAFGLFQLQLQHY